MSTVSSLQTQDWSAGVTKCIVWYCLNNPGLSQGLEESKQPRIIKCILFESIFSALNSSTQGSVEYIIP